MRYLVGVHVTLDTDGVADSSELAAEVLSQSEEGGVEEALAQVFSRDMVFTLCSDCRNHFVANPLGRTAFGVAPDLGFVQ
jgi:hypothetical protein